MSGATNQALNAAIASPAVIPGKAGIQDRPFSTTPPVRPLGAWIPAFAGMTQQGAGGMSYHPADGPFTPAQQSGPVL